MFKGNMLKEQQQNKQAKSHKKGQNQARMVKIGEKKVLERRLDMQNPKSKGLLSILTLVKNCYIKFFMTKIHIFNGVRVW